MLLLQLFATFLPLFFVVIFTLHPLPSSEDVVSLALVLDPRAVQSTLRGYVAHRINQQYCALATLGAVILHLNFDVQFGEVHSIPQALGVVSAISALSCTFLLHLVTHSMALIACSDRLTIQFCDNVRHVPHDAWINVSRILDTPKRILTLSLIFFIAYRVVEVFVTFTVEDDENLRCLLSMAIGLIALFFIIYTTAVAKAFTRLTRSTVTATSWKSSQ